MIEFAKYCPKCGNMLWIDEGKSDGFNRVNGMALYSATIYCSNNGIFSKHYLETLRRMTREEYNIVAGELLKKP